MLKLSSTLIFGFLTGMLGIIISLIPYSLRLEENMGLDFLFKLRGMRAPPGEVIVVTIDKISADKLNVPADPDKWPRSLHTRLTDNLAQAGASMIAFDIIFEDSRSTQDDILFADAISNAGIVVLCKIIKRETIPLDNGQDAHIGNLHIEKLVMPTPLLENASIASAPFPLPKVPVQVRQYWTFKTSAGDTPTLPIVAFQVFSLGAYNEFKRLLENVRPSLIVDLPNDEDELRKSGNLEEVIRILRDMFNKEPFIAELMQKELSNSETVSDDNRLLIKSLIKMYRSPESLYLNFYGFPHTITTVPYYQALNIGENSPEGKDLVDFKGKAVFVGLSDSLRLEQKDGFYTVFSQSNGVDISGVEIAATAFSNILEEMHIKPLNFQLLLAIVFVWGIMLGILCRKLPALTAAAGITGACTLYLTAALYQFTARGIWFPIAVPLFIQAPLAFFCSLACSYRESNRERLNIKEALQYYLPPDMVEQISDDFKDTITSSQTVYGTCLSTDAADYTTLSETMDPDKLSSFMNTYYEAVFAPVKKRGGIVSNVIGDSMLALWVTDAPNVESKKQACQAALDISRTVSRFNQSNDLKLPTRIGLHSGNLSLGNIGAIDHYEYRPVGDIVNTVTRIEGLNKYLGTQIMLSGDILNQVDGFMTRELGDFLLAGKARPITVHELVCEIDNKSSEQTISLCKLFGEGLDAYRNNSLDKASGIFNTIITRFGEDGPSLFYLRLCRQQMEHPVAHWDGVVCMDKK